MQTFLNKVLLRFLRCGLLLAGVALGAFSALAGAQQELRQSDQRIDVAGRRRMLTQQIALQALAAEQAPSAADRRAARAHVLDAVKRMRTEHAALVQGSAALGLGPRCTALELYLRPGDGLDDLLGDFWTDARVVTQGGSGTSSVRQAVERLREAAAPQASLPALLDEVVAAYSADSSAHAERLHHLIKRFGGLLLVAVTAVLVPLGLALRREHRRLEDERGLVRALPLPVSSGEQMYGVTASIGPAFAAPGATSDVVLRSADEAMSAAKSTGKNRRVTASR